MFFCPEKDDPQVRTSDMVAMVLTCLVILTLVVMIIGCRGGICPPPDIVVERVDTTDHTGVTVFFKNFYGNQSGDKYINLRSPEEITAFRDKLEFVIKRLEEAENRMNVHEQRGNNEMDPKKGASTLPTDGITTPQT